jgi:predicted DNA-binding transcriptional regulator AlpA
MSDPGKVTRPDRSNPLIELWQVANWLSVSRTQVMLWRAMGLMPAPAAFSLDGTALWYKSALEAWLCQIFDLKDERFLEAGDAQDQTQF